MYFSAQLHSVTCYISHLEDRLKFVLVEQRMLRHNYLNRMTTAVLLFHHIKTNQQLMSRSLVINEEDII